MQLFYDMQTGKTSTEAGEAPSYPETLEFERGGMVCTPLQGRLALGEATCAAIDAMAADPATPWAMRQAIGQAADWRRASQTMDELGYL